jgi:magnesium chelatase family protein
MIGRVYSVAFQGIDVLEIDVQVQTSLGLPAFHIVGLGDKAVVESRERIRASFHSLGLALPSKHITVNLAPADVQKEGSHYDLPVALGLMVMMDILNREDMAGYTALGELGLDGTLAPVSGVISAALDTAGRGRGLICPAVCGSEAAWGGDLSILAAPSLLALVNHFKGVQVLSPPQPKLLSPSLASVLDIYDIKGQTLAKRALEVAAAGGHNMMMVGPPGSGKSMLASRLPGILPPLEAAEALEVTMIHSLGGKLPKEGLIQTRPFRDPHHSASLPAMVGGGIRCKPGEISLAHLGVLFLDELPEFNRQTLEALRQPLESGRISVARANAHITYPARVQVVAAMNPCRCGYYGDATRECNRVPQCAQDYQNKISGPLLDRFDMTIEVPEVGVADLTGNSEREKSIEVAARVATARQIQKERYQKLLPKKLPMTNAVADGDILHKVAALDEAGQALMTQALEKMRLSGRGYHRVLRVSRTLADLEGCDTVKRHHIAEALSYRNITRQG